MSLVPSTRRASTTRSTTARTLTTRRRTMLALNTSATGKRVPTTTLSYVDASVGAKSGVNELSDLIRDLMETLRGPDVS